jgi:LPS-assembly protein
MGVTLGRVFRAKAPAPGTFTALSGLGGRNSAWLAAARFDSGTGLAMAGRALLDDQFDMTKAELVLGWRDDRLSVNAGLAHLVADPAEGRPAPTSEWTMDASFAVTQGWTALADWRYDMDAGRAASAGIGARFRNECIAVDLSLSRRHATSTSVNPMIDFGFRIDLIGFGNGTAAGPARRCEY